MARESHSVAPFQGTALRVLNACDTGEGTSSVQLPPPLEGQAGACLCLRTGTMRGALWFLGALPGFRSPKAVLSSAFLSGANNQLLMSSWAYALDVIRTRISAIGTGWVQTPKASRLTAAWGHFQLEAELEKKKKSSMESSPEACLPEAWGLPGGGRIVPASSMPWETVGGGGWEAACAILPIQTGKEHRCLSRLSVSSRDSLTFSKSLFPRGRPHSTGSGRELWSHTELNLNPGLATC